MLFVPFRYVPSNLGRVKIYVHKNTFFNLKNIFIQVNARFIYDRRYVQYLSQ